MTINCFPQLSKQFHGKETIMEKLFTRKEAALMLGISVATLDNVKATGAISYIQYVQSGSVFFTEKALLEYIAKSTHKVKQVEQKDTYRKRRTKNK